MDYIIEMKKESDSNLPFANVPLGTVKSSRKYRKSEKKKIRKMVEKFLSTEVFVADPEKWEMEEKEDIVVKANPRVNSWKNQFEGKIFEEEFKIPEDTRKQFNKEVKQV